MTPAITARDYENLIDGKWVGAADGDTFERISPAHDVAVGRYPRAGVEDLERAVAAARRAFDEGPWPTMPGVERARILNRVAEAIRADADDLAYVEALESGKPVTQARDEIDVVRRPLGVRRHALPPHVRRHVQHAGCLDVRHGAAGAGRRRGHDHPVELPAPDHQPEAALRPRRRLHGRRQAGGDHAGDHAPPRPDGAGGRAPGRRAERRHRLGTGDRHAAGGAPGRRHDQLHRIDRRRPAGDRRLEGQPQEGRARARRQEPPARLRRRRPRRRPGRRRLRRLLQHGRVLQQRQPPARAALDRRRVHRPGRRAVQDRSRRRPARPEDQGRGDRDRRAVRQDRRARRLRARRGGRPAPGRRPPRRPSGAGSWRRPCSRASRRPCGSRARRSSARSCRC